MEDNLYTELPLGESEFTTLELLNYLFLLYGSKTNSQKFSPDDLSSWLRVGALPEVYGGNIITARRMSGLRITTVEGLIRDDVRYVLDSGNVDINKKPSKKRKNKPRVEENIEKSGKRKGRKQALRTAYYYETLKQPVPDKVLPDNWKDIGFKGNQLKTWSRKKK